LAKNEIKTEINFNRERKLKMINYHWRCVCF